MKVDLTKVDEEILEEREVMETKVEIIEVNNQTSTQITTTVRNVGIWQKIVIKGNIMHEMENYNKGIMHQIIIKVMSNYL
jgi:hypothetical protein